MYLVTFHRCLHSQHPPDETVVMFDLSADVLWLHVTHFTSRSLLASGSAGQSSSEWRGAVMLRLRPCSNTEAHMWKHWGPQRRHKFHRGGKKRINHSKSANFLTTISPCGQHQKWLKNQRNPGGLFFFFSEVFIQVKEIQHKNTINTRPDKYVNSYLGFFFCIKHTPERREWGQSPTVFNEWAVSCRCRLIEWISSIQSKISRVTKWRNLRTKSLLRCLSVSTFSIQLIKEGSGVPRAPDPSQTVFITRQMDELIRK